MIKAIIENGRVANRIRCAELNPGDVDGTGANIGDLWDGVKFTTPAPTAEEIAAAAAQQAAATARAELLADTFSKMTYAEIDAYIDSNGTTVAALRGIVKKLARVVKALVDKG